MSKDKRTYRERADYLIKAVAKRRKAIKHKAIEYKGGKCQICGYFRDRTALEFHHKDPNLKNFSLSTEGITRAWSKVQSELDKCLLVCANCHREIHSGLVKL
jgi:predicted HNH restriction endonuclease